MIYLEKVHIAGDVMNCIARSGKPQTWYSSTCRHCKEVSTPLPLHKLVDWARQHNYAVHQDLCIVRRSRKEKLLQRISWPEARDAIDQLNHWVVVHNPSPAITVECLRSGCKARSYKMHIAEVESWIKAHREQKHRQVNTILLQVHHQLDSV